jgi:hypothetical protein
VKAILAALGGSLAMVSVAAAQELGSAPTGSAPVGSPPARSAPIGTTSDPEWGPRISAPPMRPKRGQIIGLLEQALALADEIGDGDTSFLIERALDEARARQFRRPARISNGSHHHSSPCPGLPDVRAYVQNWKLPKRSRSCRIRAMTFC